ncbi:MAG: DUF4405 domain-containing protein [Clostridiales bacterium]|nr:DUF4405 domain-containing protein [Clostridiales bacterium]
MAVTQKLRLLLDLAMTALLLPLMAYSLVGETAHEWLGTAMAILFLGHHALNVRWYKRLTKGRWSLPRIAQTAVNFALLFMILGLVVSGIVLSRAVFSFLPISGGASFARIMHMVCSYWGFCLMSIHIGMHWGMVTNRFRRRTESNSRRRTILLRAAAVLIAGYGAYAFFRRAIGTYMTLRTAFVFFDFEEPLAVFFLDYLAVMGLFAAIGYYAVKLLQRLEQNAFISERGKL